jgi:hypothetical protein
MSALYIVGKRPLDGRPPNSWISDYTPAGTAFGSVTFSRRVPDGESGSGVLIAPNLILTAWHPTPTTMVSRVRSPAHMALCRRFAARRSRILECTPSDRTGSGLGLATLGQGSELA